MNKPKLHSLVLSALFLSLSLLIPSVIHFTGIPDAGRILLPMHLPILIGGFALGRYYGAAIGFLSPLLSFILTGMPPFVLLFGMCLELCFYGFFCGFMFDLLKKLGNPIRIYSTLLVSMLLGRLIYFMYLLAFYTVNGGGDLFITQAFRGLWLVVSTGFPGILLQIIIVPFVIILMQRAGLIKTRGEY